MSGQKSWASNNCVDRMNRLVGHDPEKDTMAVVVGNSCLVTKCHTRKKAYTDISTIQGAVESEDFEKGTWSKERYSRYCKLDI